MAGGCSSEIHQVIDVMTHLKTHHIAEGGTDQAAIAQRCGISQRCGTGSLLKTLDEVAHGVRLRSGAIQVNHRQGRYTRPVSPRAGRGRGS